MVLDVTRTQELAWLAKSVYLRHELRGLIGGVNDVQIFGFLLARMDDVGWFAVGCRANSKDSTAKAERPQWLVESASYDAHAYQYCPGVATSVSPFNLLRYITHLKNHSGPTARKLPGIEGAGMANHFCLVAGRNRSAICYRG